MKRNVMFLALFIAAFLFPTVGSVSNADAQCQGQSKNVPAWRSKSVPLGLKKHRFLDHNLCSSRACWPCV